jgi:hypothetical protein
MSAPVITKRLGCASTYTALVWYWDRTLDKLRYYTELTGITSLSWERVLDDFSEARIRFRPRQGDDCCGKLRPIIDDQGRVLEPGLWPWAMELAIYRDGELVWMGPIFSIDETVQPDESTDFIQVTARDFLAWLDRRTIHNDIFLTDRSYDLAEIAERIVRDAFEPDDPGVLAHLQVSMTGRTSKHSIRHWENRSSEELREVARGGLDFTSVGRAIIIGSPTRDPAMPTTTLRAKDFQSGIEIRVVGAEAATAGVAVGGVPEGADPDVPPQKQYYGGLDPFFGLIESWSTAEGTHDDDFLLWIAKQRVAEGNPPPHTLSVPADSSLDPEAPVSIHELVPSRYFTLLISGTCRRLAQYMRLSHLRVVWEAGEPEKVGVTFIPQNVLDPEATP